MSSNKPLTRIEGQVLTRHASYRQGQLVLQYYVKTHSGPVLVELHNEELVCFCRQIDIDKLMPFLTQARVASLAMSNFQHQSVCGIYLKTSAALKQLQRVANDIGIALYETDIRRIFRWLKSGVECLLFWRRSFHCLSLSYVCWLVCCASQNPYSLFSALRVSFAFMCTPGLFLMSSN